MSDERLQCGFISSLICLYDTLTLLHQEPNIFILGISLRHIAGPKLLFECFDLKTALFKFVLDDMPSKTTLLQFCYSVL